MTFDLVPLPNGNLEDMLAGNQGGAAQAEANQVVAGFGEAGDLWSDIFDDPVTARIFIEYESLGGSVLGSTSNQTQATSYTNIRTALIGDALSADDLQAVANLQPSPGLDFLTNDRSGAVIRANTTDTYATQLSVPRTNLKALGLLPGGDGGDGADGTIRFSTDFPFDFDRSNGISGSQVDFVGVAAHEIGHLMGFVSGVDIVDVFSGAGPNSGDDLNGGAPGIGELSAFAIFSVLDLYRYSLNSLNELNPPANGDVLDLAFGDTPFFSLDAGATNLATFSTGSFNGDGRQASHWKDNNNFGLMDPTISNGEFGDITALDIQGFDVIGWNLASITVVIPEPSSFALCLTAILSLGFFARRSIVRIKIKTGSL